MTRVHLCLPSQSFHRSIRRVQQQTATPADILRLVKQPVGMTRQAVRAADYMDNAIKLIQKRSLGQHHIQKRSINATGTSFISVHVSMLVFLDRKTDVLHWSQSGKFLKGSCCNRLPLSTGGAVSHYFTCSSVADPLPCSVNQICSLRSSWRSLLTWQAAPPENVFPPVKQQPT